MARRFSDLPLLLQMAVAVAGMMLLPAAHATVTGDHHVARSFFYSAVILSVLLALISIAVAGRRPRDLGRANMTALVWAYLVLPVLMAVPLNEALPKVAVTDLWFEMMSSFTTTGMSVLAGVPDSIHLWRALVGWMGGFTILVAAAAILAPVNLGGVEVVTGRVPGQRDDGPYWFTGSIDPAERVRRQALRVLPAYAGVTGLLWLGLILTGEESLRAFCVALSSVSTSGILPGGDLSSGSFLGGRLAEAIVLAVLILSLSRRFWPGAVFRPQGPITRDPELRLACAVTTFVAVFLFLRHAIAAEGYEGFGSALGALWGTVFTTISFLTTTGFVSADWEVARFWSGLQTPGLVLAGLAVLGGGVATTAGGVKLLRVNALFQHGEHEMERLIHPSIVSRSALRDRRAAAYAAWVFFMLYALTIAAGTGALTVLGQGFEPALALTLAALTTTGQLAALVGAEPVAVAALGVEVKAVMAALMVIGRLETLALLVFLVPAALRR